MNRHQALERIADQSNRWDVLIVGGGASGLGAAVDAAARGYRTLLLEQADFAKATSSRSTKLIHGGVRYLRQGRLGLVRESLQERGRLLQNAPHLVQPLPFVVPAFSPWEKWFYACGLKCYDALAGRQCLEPSRALSKAQTLELLPGLNPSRLHGGIRYLDAQFDDARLALALAQTAWHLGGTLLNYCKVVALLKQGTRVSGVHAIDLESQQEFPIQAAAVINATGAFTDSIRRLDNPNARPSITLSQGTHLVLEASFLPGPTALMIPKTSDGRLLFAIPWLHHVLLGTTDCPVPSPDLEPRPLQAEIEFLLDHARKYLAKTPNASDILSVFSGLRSLIHAPGTAATASLSREHTLTVAPSGLISVAGGKWTTYRHMAERLVDTAMRVANLPPRPCATRDLPLDSNPGPAAVLSQAAAPIHPKLPYLWTDLAHGIHHEMARTLEDLLARRTRALFLDARATLEAAPEVARFLARELGKDPSWADKQTQEFLDLATHYLPLQSHRRP